ncbi:hypothetical protein GW813_09000 [bacterium]|nr:hypothetical protein [bacterium]PIV80588.1 MAG: hypothetical protein COW53_08965 [bacterium CG17_big_fil_post_rev_8_21_14_2_50_64_8]PJA75313.1 MAG: hypothetical protein CO151_06795 [bacterium CG_4_9_14_3_um_filter_65_15]
MPVTSVTNSTGPVLGQPARDYSEITDIDFMTLLVAQIQNQDPMSPMDNAEFTGQLTQFSMLDDLSALNGKMDDNILVGQSINNTAMLALVGKDVTVAGKAAWVENGEPSVSMINSDDAGTATVEVKDESGNVVATYTKDVTAGLSDISWNGTLADGSTASDGRYTLNVSVENDGAAVGFTTLMTGHVESLRYENGAGVVMVDDQEFYVSDIYKVS